LRVDSNDFCTSLFRQIDRQGLRYCLLRAPEDEAGEAPSTIELALHSEDRSSLPSLLQSLRQEGFLFLQRVPLAASDFQFDFASSLDASARFFHLIIRQSFPGGHLIASENEVFARRTIRDGRWMLSETDEFSYLLGKIHLERKITKDEERRLTDLAEILGSAAVCQIGAGLFDDVSQPQFMAAVANGRWIEAVQAAGRPPQRQRFWRHPINCLNYKLSQITCVLRRWLNPRGVLIVILGPDGAGKSTTTRKIAEFLAPLFAGYRSMIWRPQVLIPSPKAEFIPSFDPPHSKPAHGALRSVIKLLGVVADYWLAYPTIMWSLMSRRTLVTIDRDIHDILVDHVRYRYGGPMWIKRLAVALAPLPETVYLILDAEDSIILSRKNELAPEELSRQRKSYAELAARLPNASIVRTDRGMEDTLSTVARFLLTYMAGRNEEQEYIGLAPAPPQLALEPAAANERPSAGQPATTRILINFWGTLKSWILKCSTAIMDHGLLSASNFLLGVILARYLGSEQYGAFALAFSTFVLLSLVHSALAMEPMSVFAPSIYRKSLREYLGLLMWLQIAAGAVIVACAGAGGVLFRLLGDHNNLFSAFEGIALASPCVLIFWFARRSFYLELRPALALLGSVVYSVLLGVGLAIVARAHLLSPFATFLVMGIAALLTSVLLLTLLQPAASRKVITQVLSVREVCKRHWQYGRWAFASALFVWVPWNGFYSVVAHFSGLAESGALKALLNLAMPMTQTYAAFSLLFISQAARLGHEKGWEAVKILAWRIAGLYTLGSGAYWILICLFRTQLIDLMYGGHYQEIAPLVPIVALASILAGAAMGPTIAIRAMRSPASVTAIYFGSSAASILVGIPACKAWGIRGAVIGILLSSAISTFSGFLMLRSRKLHEQMSVPVAEGLAPRSASIGD
jgi:O-antigen/teichoic acid export membrane protein/thymidylate kinase